MRLKLILSFILIVIISVATMVLIARQGAASEVRSFMFQGGTNRLDTIAQSLEEYYRENQSWRGIEIFLAQSADMPMGRGQGAGKSGGMMSAQVRLADSDGMIIADTISGEPSGQLSEAEKQYAIPLKYNLQIVGYLLSQNASHYSTAEENFLVSRLNRAALIAGSAALALSLLLGLFLAYRLLRPVQALTRASNLLASGDLAQRVPVQGSDEMAVLAKTFNQMADSLQTAQKSRRAMTADIAHELRTPLAVQRANLEALQDGIYPLTSESLAPLLEQNYLLTRLVDDLSTLALADSGQLRLELVPTNLRSLLLGLIGRFQPQADGRQVRLLLSDGPDCPTTTLDPMRIEQAVSNLISNALRYTPAGGQIAMSLACTPAAVQVYVHDSGTGIPLEALPQVFERFYRADRSRSRSEGGSGLGLAIARQIVQAHGGSLTAANHPQGGAIFTISLPVSDNKAHDDQKQRHPPA